MHSVFDVFSFLLFKMEGKVLWTCPGLSLFSPLCTIMNSLLICDRNDLLRNSPENDLKQKRFRNVVCTNTGFNTSLDLPSWLESLVAEEES